MEMAIAELSTAMATQDAMNQFSTSVMRKILDQAEVSGTEMASMIQNMELSVNPHIGGHIDISI